MADITSVTITDHSDDVRRELENKTEVILTMLGLQGVKHAFEKLTNNGSVVTGYLRNSLAYAIGGEKANIREYWDDDHKKQGQYTENAPKGKQPCVYIGSNTEYAEYVEKGTSRSRAKPFLKPAILDYKDEYKAIVESVLKGENS